MRFLFLMGLQKPPSDEGGVKTEGFDGGRDKTNYKTFVFSQTTPQSRSRSTAPLTRGALDTAEPKSLPLTREVAKH